MRVTWFEDFSPIITPPFFMPLTFILIYLISKADKSPRALVNKAGFGAQDFRAQSGIGISSANTH
ncbi:hypothetical protein [Helicobacter felis]|uniref:hypothetical protein n=1 Tax=Helicobacter felis TaxID=214 RepID=UPI0018F804D2|nr:hypothetical protein [Helicobacter felis]